VLASEPWPTSGEQSGDAHLTSGDSGSESDDGSAKPEVSRTAAPAILVVVRDGEDVTGFSADVSSTTADAGGAVIN